MSTDDQDPEFLASEFPPEDALPVEALYLDDEDSALLRERPVSGNDERIIRLGEQRPKPRKDAQPAPPAGALLAIPLASITARQTEWLWPAYVAFGKLTLLDGDPNLGKSAVSLALAAAASRGTFTPTGEPLDRFDTIIVTTEDDPADTIRPRLELLDADLKRVHLLTSLNLPEDNERLRDLIRRTGARLVVLDPIVASLGEKVNTNSDHEVRRAFLPVLEMLEQERCACLGIRHLSKEGGRQAMYRGGGSIAFAALARSVLAVARDPEDEGRMVLASTKVNIAARPASLAYRLVGATPLSPVRVEWLGQSTHSAEDLIGRTSDEGLVRTKADLMADAIDKVVMAHGGQMLANDGWVAVAAEGFTTTSESMKSRALAASHVISSKVGYRSGWIWTLPLVKQKEND